jgi:hypothetical protein
VNTEWFGESESAIRGLGSVWIPDLAHRIPKLYEKQRLDVAFREKI